MFFQDDSEINPIKSGSSEFKLPAEILNYKYDQTKSLLDDSQPDEDGKLCLPI